MAENNGWFQVSWPADWQSVDISVKELVPVTTIAAAMRGPQWSGKRIYFHSDSMAVVAVLQQRRSAMSHPLSWGNVAVDSPLC